MNYEAPEVASVTPVDAPLIGVVPKGSGLTGSNPQWSEEPEQS
jgi:hypothetical protein